MPPHTIEYQAPKGKEEVFEDSQLVEEEDDVVDDVAFAHSGIRHDDRFSMTMDRYQESGNANRLLYCPSGNSLGSPNMMAASNGELLSSSAKHKKQAPKAFLNKGEEPGPERFRPRGSTMAHMFEASQAEPKKLGLVHNENVSTGAKSVEKVMAKQECTDTQPKADGKTARSASFGYFASRNLVRGSNRRGRLFEE